MRIISTSKTIFLTFLLISMFKNAKAQGQNVVVNQDPKFEQILNEKRKINSSLHSLDTYKIQIFSGKSDEAKKTLASFKRDFSTIDGTIIFTTPNYKVIVGNFKTRIEAEKYLVEIKTKYKNVFLIKPSK